MIWLEFKKPGMDSKFQAFPAAGQPKNIEAVQTTDGINNITIIINILFSVGFKEVCLENHELVDKHTDIKRKNASIM